MAAGRKKRPVLQKPPAGLHKAKKALEAFEKLGKRPRRGKLADALWESAELLEAAKSESLQEEKERREYAAKLRAWHLDREKPRPSKLLSSYFEELGDWRKNEDGTWTGYVHTPASARASDRLSNMREWFMSWQERLHWLDDEPVWVALGLSLSGVESAIRDRYARIEGQVSIVSGWVMSRQLCNLKGIECKGLASLLFHFWEEVIPTLYELHGMKVTQATIFAHWGPSRPVGDIL